MNRHLVAVKIRVEGRTRQRVQLNSFALNQLRLEGLNSQAVQRWSTIQKHGVPLHHVFQDVPNHRLALVDDLLSRFNRLYDSALNQLANHKRLEQFCRHVLR